MPSGRRSATGFGGRTDHPYYLGRLSAGHGVPLPQGPFQIPPPSAGGLRARGVTTSPLYRRSIEPRVPTDLRHVRVRMFQGLVHAMAMGGRQVSRQELVDAYARAVVHMWRNVGGVDVWLLQGADSDIHVLTNSFAIRGVIHAPPVELRELPPLDPSLPPTEPNSHENSPLPSPQPAAPAPVVAPVELRELPPLDPSLLTGLTAGMGEFETAMRLRAEAEARVSDLEKRLRELHGLLGVAEDPGSAREQLKSCRTQIQLLTQLLQEANTALAIAETHGQHAQPNAAQAGDPTCIICMSSEPTHAFLPCGHFTCCEHCAMQVRYGDPKCPTCRADVASTARIFQ